MANPWFRLYSEFASDPKVQMLSEVDQRRLLMLFCLRCNETLETLHETEIAFHLRISMDELLHTKAIFAKKGFIDEHWNIENWNRRQFISDSSTERVRKFRGKKQDETLHSPGNAECNGPEQNRTETDTEQKQQKPYPSTPKNGVSDEISKEEVDRLKVEAHAAEMKRRAEARAAERKLKAEAKAAAKAELKKLAAAKKISMKAAKPPTKSEAAAARHSEFKVAVFEYWKSKNPEIDCPWQEAEGKQLELWLRASPNTTITHFKEMLRNRYRSENIVHSERPSVWMKNITNYANGPLNTYRQPINGGSNGKQIGRTEKTLSAGAEAAREIIESGTDRPSEDHRETYGNDVFSGSGGEQKLLSHNGRPTIEGKF